MRTNAEDIQKFLCDKLGIEMTVLRNLQIHNIGNCVLIEMCNLEAAERVAASHHLKHSMPVGPKNVNIPVYMEDMATNVRLHDLPPGIPNAVVADHLKQ